MADGEGFLYVAAVMDLFSRMIVGWSFSRSLSADLVIDAISMATDRREPAPGLIHGWVSLYRLDCCELLKIAGGTLEIAGPYSFRGIAGFATDGIGIWVLNESGQISRFNTRRKRTDELIQMPFVTNKGFSPWSSSLDFQTSTIWVSNYKHSITEVPLSRK